MVFMYCVSTINTKGCVARDRKFSSGVGHKALGSQLHERLARALAQARPKVSRAELARRLGVSPAAVSYWLNGTRTCPRETIERIARITNVQPSWLFGATSDGPGTARNKLKVGGRVSHRGEKAMRLEWGFSKAPDDRKVFGDAGVYATPASVPTIVREDGQNSRDEKLDTADRVVMRFRIIELDSSSKRYARFLEALRFEDQLANHLEAVSNSYFESKLGTKLSAGLSHINRGEKLLLVAIEDYCTKGLVGSDFDSTKSFAALVRDSLNSRKSTVFAGGIFGVGSMVNIACSRLGTVVFSSKPVDGPEGRTRVAARADLTYHEIDGDPQVEKFAGTGWLGRRGESGLVESTYLEDDHPLVDALCVRRDQPPPGVDTSEMTGTSILIVAFSDPKHDQPTARDLVTQFVDAVSENLWPAIVNGDLAVWVEHYQNDASKPIASMEIDPTTHTSTRFFCEAWEAYQAGDTKPSLVEAGDVVSVPIELGVPATRKEVTKILQHPALRSECRLVVRLSDVEESAGDPHTSDVAMVRGLGMVVRYQKRSNVVVGARPFHAILAAGLLVGETLEQQAGEQFLRVAEPPAHDRWESNQDLQEKFARGGGAALKELQQRIAEELQKLLRSVSSSDSTGPDAVKRLLQLRVPRPVAGDRSPAKIHRCRPEIREGRWVIEAEVSVNPIAKSLRVTPILSFDREGGSGVVVDWKELEVVDGPATEIQGGFRLKPRAKRFTFKAVSDETSHPIPVSDAVARLTLHTVPLDGQE